MNDRHQDGFADFVCALLRLEVALEDAAASRLDRRAAYETRLVAVRSSEPETRRRIRSTLQSLLDAFQASDDPTTAAEAVSGQSTKAAASACSDKSSQSICFTFDPSKADAEVDISREGVSIVIGCPIQGRFHVFKLKGKLEDYSHEIVSPSASTDQK